MTDLTTIRAYRRPQHTLRKINMITIHANTGHIDLDGKSTGMTVVQTRAGTKVYRRENMPGGYFEYKLPHQRYSLAHTRPASGNPGIADFERDLNDLLKQI